MKTISWLIAFIAVTSFVACGKKRSNNNQLTAQQQQQELLAQQQAAAQQAQANQANQATQTRNRGNAVRSGDRDSVSQAAGGRRRAARDGVADRDARREDQAERDAQPGQIIIEGSTLVGVDRSEDRPKNKLSSRVAKNIILKSEAGKGLNGKKVQTREGNEEFRTTSKYQRAMQALAENDNGLVAHFGCQGKEAEIAEYLNEKNIYVNKDAGTDDKAPVSREAEQAEEEAEAAPAPTPTATPTYPWLSEIAVNDNRRYGINSGIFNRPRKSSINYSTVVICDTPVDAVEHFEVAAKNLVLMNADLVVDANEISSNRRSGYLLLIADKLYLSGQDNHLRAYAHVEGASRRNPPYIQLGVRSIYGISRSRRDDGKKSDIGVLTIESYGAHMDE